MTSTLEQVAAATATVLIVRAPRQAAVKKNATKTTVDYTVVEWPLTSAEWLLLTAGVHQFFISEDHKELFGSHSALASYILARYHKNPEWRKKTLDLSFRHMSRQTAGDVSDRWVDIPPHEFMLVGRNIDTDGAFDTLCQFLADCKRLKNAHQDPLPAFESMIVALHGDQFWFGTDDESSEAETDETELDNE